MQTQVEMIESNWKSIAPFFTPPDSHKEYLKKRALMESLLNKDYPDDHPIFVLINLLGQMIDQYELNHSPELKQMEALSNELSPIELLRYLMKEHKLKQRDLTDVFGSQSHVSEVLKGKQELSLHHIKALAQKFKIKPEFFL